MNRSSVLSSSSAFACLQMLSWQSHVRYLENEVPDVTSQQTTSWRLNSQCSTESFRPPFSSRYLYYLHRPVNLKLFPKPVGIMGWSFPFPRLQLRPVWRF